MLAQHEHRLRGADILGLHDLVGLGVLDHAVLMNPRLMSKSVGTNDRLVRGDGVTGAARDEFAGAAELRGVDTGLQSNLFAARAEHHHEFLERGVARAFADAVERALGLPRTGAETGERIGDRETKVVVAMHGDRHILRARRILDDTGNERTELVGHRIADGVGDIERGRAGPDDGGEHLVEKFRIAATGVLG